MKFILFQFWKTRSATQNVIYLLIQKWKSQSQVLPLMNLYPDKKGVSHDIYGITQSKTWYYDSTTSKHKWILGNKIVLLILSMNI